MIGNRLAPAILGATLLLSACNGNDTSGTDVPDSQYDSRTGMLAFFDGAKACERLERHIEDAVLTMLDTSMHERRRSLVEEPSERLASADLEASTRPPASVRSPVRRPSSTKEGRPPPAQADIDAGVGSPVLTAPDKVIRDGRHIWYLQEGSSGLALNRIDVGDDGALTLVSRSAWPTTGIARRTDVPSGLFRIDADRIAVLSQLPSPDDADDSGDGSMAENRVARPGPTRLRLVDTTADGLTVTWSVDLDGALLGARQQGTRLHLVTADYLTLPEGVAGWPPAWPGNEAGRNAQRSAIDQQLRDNERLIRHQSLTYWLAQLDLGDQPTPAVCASVALVDGRPSLGTTRLTTIDLNSRATATRIVLAGAAAEPSWGTPHDPDGTPSASLLLRTMDGIPLGSGGHPGEDLHRFFLDAGGEFQYHGSTRLHDGKVSVTDLTETGTGIVRIIASRMSDHWTAYLSHLAPAQAPAVWRTVGGIDPLFPDDSLLISATGVDSFMFLDRAPGNTEALDLTDPGHPVRLGPLPVSITQLVDAGSHRLLSIGRVGDPHDGTGLGLTLVDYSLPWQVRETAKVILNAEGSLAAGLATASSSWRLARRPAGPAPAAGEADLTLAFPINLLVDAELNPGNAGIAVVEIRSASGAQPLTLKGVLPTRDLEGPVTTIVLRAPPLAVPVFVGNHVVAVAPGGARSARIDAPGQPISTLALP